MKPGTGPFAHVFRAFSLPFAYMVGLYSKVSGASCAEGALFCRASNGVTILCPDAEVNSTGVVDGETYTKRDRAGLDELAWDASRWDELRTSCTSGVMNVSNLFFDPDLLDENGNYDGGVIGYFKWFDIDIGGWDTSSVTDMSWMFDTATAFNQRIGEWNTSNVENMRGVFSFAESFNQDIKAWDTSRVTDMSWMFAGAEVFNQDINEWDISSVLEASGMFYRATVFNEDIGGWDTSSVTDMSYMFEDADAFNQDIGGWDTSQVRNMRLMFKGADAFNQDLSSWNTTSVEYCRRFSAKAGSWTEPKPTFTQCST